jgi:glycosyltransferase involved in cell wall biosynthesis
MRICLISREYPPETGWGGIGTFTHHLANGLAQQGHDIHVIALTGNKKGTPAPPTLGLTVHRVNPHTLCPPGGLFNFCVPVTRPMLDETAALWHHVLKLSKQQPFDIIECPEHFAEGLFPAIARIAPLIIRLHTPHSKLVKERFHNFEPSFDHRILTGLERISMLAADKLVSPSEDLAAYVANDLNIPLDHIKIVRNPVDIEKFKPDGARELSSSDSSQTNILFVGRVEARKGIHYLIDAVPRVVKACPQARFLIIGSDTNTGAGHASVTAELKSKLATNNCEHAVQFLQHIPLDEMPNYYRSADICVLPSLYDNAPMTAIEAMASGKPSVVSSAGGAKEYVTDTECGFVVPPADADALAQALIKLVENGPLRKQMGNNARQRAVDQFSIERTCQDTLAVYEETRAKFMEGRVPALYPGEPENLEEDLTALIGSMEKRLYELMFTYSWRFRIKHWHKRAREMFAGRH